MGSAALAEGARWQMLGSATRAEHKRAIGAFISKGDLDGGGAEFARDAREARPLSLSDAGTKAAPRAVNEKAKSALTTRPAGPSGASS